MRTLNNFQHVAVSVSDVERSLGFYRDLLGFQVLGAVHSADGVTVHFLDMGNRHVLQLFSFKAVPKPDQWVADDLQVGLRHVGFKVRDVDGTAARLRQANVPFTLNPRDATGGVRIAFFKDPDGTLLEIVEGKLQYHVDGPAKGTLPLLEPEGDSLLFDHVAITVSNLSQALAFYENLLGFQIMGQLLFKDERGFTITYLKAGTAVLELFSFSRPTQANRSNPDVTVLGLKYIGFNVADLGAELKSLKAQGIRILREPTDSLGNVRTALFEGPDGLALELVEGAYSHIQV